MTSTNKYSEFIRNRHSPRAFLPEPMPVEDIKQVLEDAQSAPSNSNTQPWNVHVAVSYTHLTLPTSDLV